MSSVGRVARLCFGGLLVLCSSCDPEPEVVETVPEALTLATGRAEHSVLADLDGDGDGDLVLAGDFRHGPLSVYRRDAGGGLTHVSASSGLPSVSGKGRRLAAGDLDGDTDLDLVLCTEPKGSARAVCRVLFNCLRERGQARFDCRSDAAVLAGTEGQTWTPHLADADGDRDLDLFLLPALPATPAQLWRNDLEQRAARFTRTPAQTLPLVGPLDDLALVVRNDPLPTLRLFTASAASPLLAWDDARARFVPATAPRLPSPSGTRRVASADLNNDRLVDVVVHDASFGFTLLLQKEAGHFTPFGGALAGLPPIPAVSDIALEDFNRDGRVDLVVASQAQSARVFLNVTPAGAPNSPRFQAAPNLTPTSDPQGRTSAALFKRVGACDYGIELALTARVDGQPTLLLTFPDASAHKTVQVTTAQRVFDAPFLGACVQGTNGSDRISGHRVRSALSGGAGNDTLSAKAGVTVMRGGPGRDTFEAAGVTVIQLPPGDIVQGERIDCADANAVFIDTPLSIPRLRAAGVVFEGCFSPCAPNEEDCEEIHQKVFTAALNLGALGGMDFGDGLDIAIEYGPGFGECTSNAQCYAIGLDVCRTAGGGTASSQNPGRCYPSDFNGQEGPVKDWCKDPFWARYRREEIDTLMANDGRKIVFPVTFWIVRSESATPGGGCLAGGTAPKSLAEWNENIASTMSAAMAFYGRWGIRVDYQVRIVTVPDDSAFIADTTTDRCRTYLELEGLEEDNAQEVSDLVAAYPSAYRDGELNVYLTDTGGIDQSISFELNGKNHRALLLRSSAGAFGHEFGHGLGLPHPHDNNSKYSNENPAKSESRNSWLARPFPDAALDRLHVCNGDNDCAGADADPGACRIAPGAATGFCQNLKKDCAEDGDSVCDTPWDANPCFRGVSDNWGEACTTNEDCQSEKSSRGKNYLTYCGGNGFCVKNECTANADCGAGSWCANGACVIWKSGINACCDMYTDRGGAFDHNECYEKLANGTVIASPGVGAPGWPKDANIMAYHSNSGRASNATEGQHDRVVCVSSYRTEFGPLLRIPKSQTGSQPCSLRPGDNGYDYAGPGFSIGGSGTTVRVAHGACESGICELGEDGFGVYGTCVPSNCSDGLAGEGEASVDCGGICPNACPTERSESPTSSACASDSDCVSGYCDDGICQGTCEDGVQNGSETSIDHAGVSFDTTCNLASQGSVCRFNQDCGSGSCVDDGACLVSSDCPINNEGELACTSASDCHGGGDCLVTLKACTNTGCFLDAQCASGHCQLPAGRCVCEDDGECPGAGTLCEPVTSMCTDQCADGRCLGECGGVLGGG